MALRMALWLPWHCVVRRCRFGSSPVPIRTVGRAVLGRAGRVAGSSPCAGMRQASSTSRRSWIACRAACVGPTLCRPSARIFAAIISSASASAVLNSMLVPAHLPGRGCLRLADDGGVAGAGAIAGSALATLACLAAVGSALRLRLRLVVGSGGTGIADCGAGVGEGAGIWSLPCIALAACCGGGHDSG